MIGIFLYVWLVLLSIRIWGTIRFLITAILPSDKLLLTNLTFNKANHVLLYLQAFGDPSQAFFNCILFCLFDKEVRGRIFRAITCRVSAPKEHDSTCSSLPSVGPSDYKSQRSDPSAEMSDRAKLLVKENPGHEKLYRSVNCRWSESNEDSM
ncbi:hypothetical protein DPMN_125913 [Dreissena polymorpha]|uniref:G-protein coupled receptors family 2 profile 2 domain-containing protein n=1 Tax=Dreissena polymorpha TaxID=45954 RepID=A0A9D4GYK9_DREPO|nr:hypothetical protein DPMN_125913 [Dreissena polymorpha]